MPRSAWPTEHALAVAGCRVRAAPTREAHEGVRMRRAVPVLRDRGERCPCRFSRRRPTSHPAIAPRRCATSSSSILLCHTSMAIFVRGPSKTRHVSVSAHRAARGREHGKTLRRAKMWGLTSPVVIRPQPASSASRVALHGDLFRLEPTLADRRTVSYTAQSSSLTHVTTAHRIR